MSSVKQTLQATAKVSLHTILLGVGGTVYSPYTLEPLKTIGIKSHKATKLAIKLHAHFVRYKLLKNLIQTLITKGRLGALLVTPLIPITFFLFPLLVVKGLHGASALEYPFSLIEVGSVCHCLHTFFLFLLLSNMEQHRTHVILIYAPDLRVQPPSARPCLYRHANCR